MTDCYCPRCKQLIYRGSEPHDIQMSKFTHHVHQHRREDAEWDRLNKLTAPLREQVEVRRLKGERNYHL